MNKYVDEILKVINQNALNEMKKLVKYWFSGGFAAPKWPKNTPHVRKAISRSHFITCESELLCFYIYADNIHGIQIYYNSVFHIQHSPT